MEDFLPARDFGLGLALAARRGVVEALLDDRGFLESVERVLSTTFVSALRFDRPRTLPVALAASWSTSIGCSSVAGSWWASPLLSFTLSVRLRWTEFLRGTEIDDGRLTGGDMRVDRMLLQFFRRQETSLSSCAVESSLHLARLISV